MQLRHEFKTMSWVWNTFAHPFLSILLTNSNSYVESSSFYWLCRSSTRKGVEKERDFIPSQCQIPEQQACLKLLSLEVLLHCNGYVACKPSVSSLPHPSCLCSLICCTQQYIRRRHVHSHRQDGQYMGCITACRTDCPCTLLLVIIVQTCRPQAHRNISPLHSFVMQNKLVQLVQLALSSPGKQAADDVTCTCTGCTIVLLNRPG